jgi:hypothetical protein
VKRSVVCRGLSIARSIFDRYKFNASARDASHLTVHGVAASIRPISRQMIKSSGHSGLRSGVVRVNKCLTALHTITKCRLKVRLTRSAQSLNVNPKADKI